MQGVSVFFDTNVLVYAHDELSPFHDNSALLLDLAIKKDITGIISEQIPFNDLLRRTLKCLATNSKESLSNSLIWLQEYK